MSDFRLKVKVETNEFDAEGTKEFVEEQYQRFLDALSAGKTAHEVARNGQSNPILGAVATGPLANGGPIVLDGMDRIFRTDANVISLSARPQGGDRELDAILLLLYGHKQLRAAEVVSADDLLAGLKRSGYTVQRADRLVARGEREGVVNKSGVRRGSRYRLTNPGLTRAQALMEELMRIVP